MKPLKQENLKELTEKVLDLVAKTSVEIGHRSDAQTLASLSKIFAEDLIQEKRFGNMTFNQVQQLGQPKEQTLWYQEPVKLLK